MKDFHYDYDLDVSSYEPSDEETNGQKEPAIVNIAQKENEIGDISSQVSGGLIEERMVSLADLRISQEETPVISQTVETNSSETAGLNDKKKTKTDPKKTSSVKVASKAKKEDLEKDQREVLNVVFIGHVDAGKSTIGGHLLLLTGQVDKRTMEKYEKEAKEKNRESWYLSWALDTNTEERDKGKTVEVGKAMFETMKKRIVILDAPGHKGFVPNMISGAAQADVAILVISARKGEFETGFEKGGQTREHALIAKITGTKHLIVLVNKMDDPTVSWDKKRNETYSILEKIGFKSQDMYFLPCSGFTGANLKDSLTDNVCDWYKGPSLVEYIDKLPQMSNNLDDPPRILISDRYKDMGTVVMCKVTSGYLAKGDSFVLMPNKVANILSLEDIELAIAKVGENIKLRITNIEEEEISLAQLMVLDCKNIIPFGYQAILHVHNAIEDVILEKIVHFIDKKTGEKMDETRKYLKQDDICVARLKTLNPICIAPFSDFPELGKFALRNEQKTVAVGKVIRVKPHSGPEKTTVQTN